MSIQVVLADDHHIFRQGLIRLIESHPPFHVIAEVSDGKEALSKIKELKPDIAILDVSMPNMTGLEVAEKIRPLNLGVKIIILTMYTEEEFFTEAIGLGIKGYILKDNTSDDLITALEYVSSGSSYISPLLSEFVSKLENKKRSLIKKKPTVNDLTTTERKILRCLAENKTSKQIADELCVSFRTIQNHRTNICNKLNLKGMNALLKFVVENKSFF